MKMAKDKHWFPRSVKGNKLQDIADWMNRWADYSKHPESLDDKIVTKKGKPNHITEFGRGYQQAVRDICDRFGFEYHK